MRIIRARKGTSCMSIHTAHNNVPDSWNEVDQLIRLLSRWGVTYLVGLEHTDNPAYQEEMQLSPVELIQRLAQCDEFPPIKKFWPS